MGPRETVRAMLGWAVAVASRPVLWPTALRAVIGFAPDRWWRRPPFLPLPDRRLMAFRSESMHGDAAAVPTAADLVTWLRWRRSQPQTAAATARAMRGRRSSR